MIQRLPRNVLLLAVFISLVCSTAEAQRNRLQQTAAARRAREISALKGQLSAARGMLSQANVVAAQANSKIDSANSSLSTTRHVLESAKKDESEASASLRKLEESILEGEDPDSAFSEAKEALDKAKEEVTAAEQRAFASKEYKKQADDRVGDEKGLAELKQRTLLADSGYASAKAKLKEQHDIYEKHRRGVLKANKEWQDLTAALRTARGEVHSAEGTAVKEGMRRTPAREQARNANASIATMQTVVGRLEARLRALGVNPDPPPPRGKEYKSGK